jgi:predicted ATPase/class 3 adenylate cyclase
MLNKHDGRTDLPTGTVTFLRTDVEGSMALARTVGGRWDAINAAHIELIRAAVTAHGGVCVKTEGDAVFGVFPEAGAAVAAAVEAQRSLAAHPWPDDAPVRVRMGLHSGEAHLAGDDYGGFDVSRAARVSAVGHGGQIVLSDPTRVLVASSLPDGVMLRDLGRHALKDVPEPELLWQLVVPGLRTEFPALRTAQPTTGSLPLRMTSFLGRQQELLELSSLLAAGRLVTLTGPGGIGKTSLAVELARREAPSFPDGAWFVSLDSIAEPSQVTAVVARTLGLYDGPERPAAAALGTYLAGRSALLVLDNFEHLLDAAVDVATLLRTSPASKVIVTSRAPLRIPGEQEYPVASLALAGGEAAGADPVDGPAARRLFVERARSARPGWDAGPDIAIVDTICARLDGLPLGIELAAARVSLLPLAAIRDRLAANLPLPGSGPRDVPGRQRTLDGTIAWSYDLLTPDQQRLLRDLAVFEGGFDLEQARVVADLAGGPDRILDEILVLAEQSLVTRDLRAEAHMTGPGDGAVRFRLLKTIQAFALRQLAAEGREEAVRRRHAQAYLELAEAGVPHMLTREQAAWLDRLALVQADLRAAVLWAVHAGEVELALRLVAALWRFWQLDGHLAEGHDLAAAALAMPGAEAPTRWRLGAITAAGGIAYWRGEPDEAERLYKEQLDLAIALGDAVARADAGFNLLSASFIANRVEALKASEDVSRQFERLGDARGMARVQWGKATMLLSQGRADEAVPIFHSSMERFEALGDPMYHAMAMGSLAWVEFMRGNPAAAWPWAIRSLVEVHAMRDVSSTTITLQEARLTALDLGRVEDAAVLTGAFEGLCERFGVRPPILLEQIIEARRPRERIEEALEPGRLATLVERGRRMSLDEAVAFVLRMDDEMGKEAVSQARLPP